MFPAKITRIAGFVVMCLAAATALDGCGGGGGGAPSGPPISMPRAVEGATADNTFGFKLLAQAVSTAPAGSNVVLSPVSISQMLMLAYNGAGGQTATEIANALGYGNIPLQQADVDTQNVVNSLTYADPSVQISIANGTWLQTGETFSSTYTSNCEQYLGAQMQPLDFTNTGAAAASINDWVRAKTNGNITSIAQPGTLAGSDFALANAVYFHGAWSQKYFDPAETKPAPFTLAGGSTVQAPMMHASLQVPLGFDANGTGEAVELPYGSGRLYLLVIVPTAQHTLNDVLLGLEENGASAWTSRMQTNNLGLSLPKFTVSYADPNLQNDLAGVGIKSLFTPQADLTSSGLSPGHYLREALFKSTLAVDETGTTAAASTIGVGAAGFTGMTVNQPFVCAICDSVTGATLFTAVINNPTSN